MSRTCFHSFVLFSLLIFIAGCSYGPFAENKSDVRQVPREYVPARASHPNYFADIKPLIEQRCTVCHGCYDSPCQLKLESFQGLLRGANKELVYNGTRLFGAQPTRLFEDAQTTAQWRDRAFYPVLNEFEDTEEANLSNGVMAQLLELKREHPLPEQAILSADFDLGLVREQFCPRSDEMAEYKKKHPLWGMPYALPGLTKKEHDLMTRWLKNGAPSGEPATLPAELLTQIAQWEAFFNGDDPKSQLVGRYLYEHLFLANLHFSSSPHIYFRLVRSRTPPNQPLDRIATTRPFDDPGVNRVYYRLWQDPSTPVSKTYMPYLLDEKRWVNWQKWFFQTDYAVASLPSYEPSVAANPFTTFAQLPVNSRYKFLLEEAQFSIMNFIKGPVCRGSVALSVIQDHFWVFFVAPDNNVARYEEALFQRAENYLQMPAEKSNTFLPLGAWLGYSEMQRKYLSAKAGAISQFSNDTPLNLDMIWNGDGTNRNAALTIFRHNDSASVHQGLIGETPKTAWVIGYPLLERIHYLLVAGFDVYGNVSHQALTRLYMDFLRMEGEMNFVAFMPPEVQKSVVAGWYLNAEGAQKKYLDFFLDQLKVKSQLQFKTADPKTELLAQFAEHLGPMGQSPMQVDFNDHRVLEPLRKLRGPAVGMLPEITLIRVPGHGLYSLLRNNDFTNLSSLFGEEARRRPEQDEITLVRGVVGSYPNSFMQVEPAKLSEFVQQLTAMRTEKDFVALRDRYGVRRTNPDFWAFSDKVHADYHRLYPDEAALLDYNRLENR